MFPKGRRGDREEDERAAGQDPQGLVIEMQSMKFQLYRVLMTLSAIAALALAGGATLKGW